MQTFARHDPNPTMVNKRSTSKLGIVLLYTLATLTIAAFGYGIGGAPALRAGTMYAAAGLLLGLICVGFAPRFIMVIALATGMLGSILRASTSPEIVALIPRQSTEEYLRAILMVCGAIGFGGGLYGGFRFTGKGLFNWISKLILRRAEFIDIANPSPQQQFMRDLVQHFEQSERMYFSALAAVMSTLIAQIEIRPMVRSLFIIFFSVLIATNLMWALGAWLKPRLRVLGGVFRILQQMWEALAAFLVGYLAIVFIFACFFAAAWQHNQSAAFKGAVVGASPRFSDFVYFSIITMATVGYGDVFPSDGLTRTLACIEVIFGVGWVTVVLSAAAALARPKVDEMLRQEWAEQGETDPDSAAPAKPAKGEAVGR